MKNNNILTRKKDKNKLLFRPSYYMRPTKEECITKIEKQSTGVKISKTSVPGVKEYKLNLDKINTLEDVKEILGALNIKITVSDGIVSHQGYNIDTLMKYMDIDNGTSYGNDNAIELDFKDKINRLAGIDFGREVYETQMKNKIDYSNKNAIIFPDTIEDISITFIQGLTEDIFNKIEKYEFSLYFYILGNDNIIRKIMKTIAQI